MADQEGIIATVAWQRLQQALLEANWKDDGSGFPAARAALDAVCEFIRAVDPLHGRTLATPLTVLNIALESHSKGAVPLMLQTRELGGGRRPDALGREYIKAYAAAAMTNLMELGSSRISAAQDVSDVLQMYGVTRSGRHRITASTVASWREQLKAGSAQHAVAGLYRDVLAERQDPAHPMWHGTKRGEATPRQYVLAQLSTVIVQAGKA